MALGDIEDVVHAVALRLASADFTTALRAVDAEKDTESGYTPVLEAVFEEERTQAPTFPCAEVVGLHTTYEQDQDQSVVEATHFLAIDFTVVGDDEQVITRTCRRLARAALDTMNKHLFEGLGAVHAFVDEVDYSPLSPTRAGQAFALVKGAKVLLRVVTLT